VFLRYNIIMPETQRAALEQAERYVQQQTRTTSKVTPLRKATGT
jgi:hypothetical protein